MTVWMTYTGATNLSLAVRAIRASDGFVWNSTTSQFEAAPAWGPTLLPMIQRAPGFYAKNVAGMGSPGEVFLTVVPQAPNSPAIAARVAYVEDHQEVVTGGRAILGIPSLADINAACGIMAVEDSDVASMDESRFLYQLRASTVGGP